MKVIITAAGLGSRFKKIGIKKPKFAIVANGHTLFYWSLVSLKKFFNEEWIFIFRKENFQSPLVKQEIRNLGIKKYKIVLLDFLTTGQAETVMYAKKYIKSNDSILIYNIDTHINPLALKKKWFKYDGLIVTMKAKGSHWSFARINNKGFAVEVSEKERISNHASVGLYYFSKFKDFSRILKNHQYELRKKWKEVYICPMYKYLIESNYKVLVKDVKTNDVICLGTPDEVMLFDNKFLKKNLS